MKGRARPCRLAPRSDEGAGAAFDGGGRQGQLGTNGAADVEGCRCDPAPDRSHAFVQRGGAKGGRQQPIRPRLQPC